MKPYQVTFYVYAENEEQAKALQAELNQFVRSKYNSGIIVTADKMINALHRFGHNFMVNNFLKK